MNSLGSKEKYFLNIFYLSCRLIGGLGFCLTLSACLGSTAERLVESSSYSKLEIFPVVQNISIFQQSTFYGINGVPPYTYSISLGEGTIDSATGKFTATGTLTTSVVKVVDFVGQSAVAIVFIVDQLTMSPTTFTMTAGTKYSFTATGGKPPYSYKVLLGEGSIDPANGFFISSGNVGTTQLEVKDMNGFTAQAVVTMVAKPQVLPISPLMNIDEILVFSTAGGVGPYVYSIFSGGGTINNLTGSFLAPSTPQNVVVEVTDSFGFKSQTTINVIRLNQVSLGTHHSCILRGADSKVKCWGLNTSGQLGKSHTSTLGDDPGEMGSYLTTLDFGYTGSTVPVQISSGDEFSCVLIVNGDIRCWGLNSSGQLGLYNTLNLGDNELLNNPPAQKVQLSTVATMISTGANHVCAVFDTGQVKCWGNNSSGQLGYGHITTLGDGAGEMAALSYLDLGTSDPIKKIASGAKHNCILTTTNKVKCWGDNTYGQLGLGDANNRGDAAGEMGTNLPFVNVADTTDPSVLVRNIMLGQNHTCILYSNNKIKCWGDNTYGQLGYEDSLARGNSAGTLPTLLAYVDIGDFSVKHLSAKFNNSCAVNYMGQAKCWGKNDSAQLGAHYSNHIGLLPGDMGANLSILNLNTIDDVQQVDFGNSHTCVVLKDNSLKCFGLNANGQLGLERVSSPANIIGDSDTEMGAGLFPVNL